MNEIQPSAKNFSNSQGALDLLRVCLPHRVLLGLHMPLVGPPAICEIARNAKRLQQCLKFQKDRVLSSSQHLG